jgi:hypothetical protein
MINIFSESEGKTITKFKKSDAYVWSPSFMKICLKTSIPELLFLFVSYVPFHEANYTRKSPLVRHSDLLSLVPASQLLLSEHGLSCKVHNHSTAQELSSPFTKPQGFNTEITKARLHCILSHLNSAYNIQFHTFKIPFNIILPFRDRPDCRDSIRDKDKLFFCTA